MTTTAHSAPTGESPPVALELTKVSKWFRREVALANFSLRMPAGSVLGLIGPNGAGKSTTMKLLMGMLRPNSGSVSVFGEDPIAHRTTLMQRIGYVPENVTIHPWMRVGEALRFCKTFYSRWNDQLVSDFLRDFRLDAHKKVKQLSKGNATKLALILALAHEPELLILDEPMAGLDPLIREELLRGVLQTGKDGSARTIIFSSHTFDDVQRLADSIALLNEGGLLLHAPLDDLLGHVKRVRAVLKNGEAPLVHHAKLVHEKRERGAWEATIHVYNDDAITALRSNSSIEKMEVNDLGLEEIFKDYVRGQRSKP